jgi:DNA-binding NarL/FixJ family response regulator
MTPKSPKSTRTESIDFCRIQELLQTAVSERVEDIAEREEKRKRDFLRNHLAYLYLAAVGADRKQMAKAMNLSLRTIEAVYGKLLDLTDCLNVAHLVGTAFERGYLVVEGGEIKINKEALL